MSRIKILTPDIYNLISAGEVVERPSSVVKELVENSIDAGATEIEISIENGGISLIRVSDNGIGILPEDIKSAFFPHATSKLKLADDLDTIATLGFRGEALASISAVSEVNVVSKTQNADVAVSISVKGGVYGDIEYGAGTIGTTITVQNLFYNTPARIKFLKKPKSEEHLVTAKIQELALANSDIVFKYTVDNKFVFSTDGNSMLSALYSVYDRATMRELVAFSKYSGAFSLEGYFSKPTYTKANRSYQTIIINGRVVECRTVATAIERAYAPYLMKRSFPMFVVSIVLPFDTVDVNVHPAKSEVRFSDSNAVFGFVFSAMREMLSKIDVSFKTLGTEVLDDNAKEILQTSFADNANYAQNTFNKEHGENTIKQGLKVHYNTDSTEKLNQIQTIKIYADETQNDKFEICQAVDVNDEKFGERTNKKFTDISSLYSLERKSRTSRFSDNAYSMFSRQCSADSEDLQQNADKTVKISHNNAWGKNYKIVGQLFDTYIVLEKEDNAYLIDQHAAHERILYDKLVASIDNSYSQPMLFPYEIKVNGEEYEYFKTVLPALVRLGFEAELSEQLKIYFTAIPLLLVDIELNEFVTYLFRDINFEKEIKLDEILIDKLAQIACKSAIKGGNALNEEQVSYILDVFFDENGGLPTQCPHGRPAVIKVSKYEIEKKFKRKL